MEVFTFIAFWIEIPVSSIDPDQTLHVNWACELGLLTGSALCA